MAVQRTLLLGAVVMNMGAQAAAATIEVLATPILEWIVALPDSVCSPYSLVLRLESPTT